MYNEFSLLHIDTTVVSIDTSLNTVSPKHKMMALTALSLISVFLTGVTCASFCASPFNASTHFCWIRKALIFNFHNPKSLLPVNFSISHFEPMIFGYWFDPCPTVAANFVNSLKIALIKTWYVEQINQATKTTCVKVINTSKSRKQRENTRNLFT